MKTKRILLKLSGESLMGQQGQGIDPVLLQAYCREISEAASMGYQIAIVIGGGNIFRGLQGSQIGFDRVKGDQMGMLATIINSLALESGLQTQGIKAKVYTAIRMEPIGELYKRDEVIRQLENETVCILGGGTGNPFFTTDTAAALRAVEIKANLLLKGTRVDGIYAADPEKDPQAKRFDTLSFREAIEKNLKVMDQTAFTLCEENHMPILVFNMNEAGNLQKVLKQQGVFTLVKD